MIIREPKRGIFFFIPETGSLSRRTKRNFLQFGYMMWCEVGRALTDYNNYGCFCGLGGKGNRPVDDFDR